MSEELRQAVAAGDREAALGAAQAMLAADAAEELAEEVVELLRGDSAWVREGVLELLRTVPPEKAILDTLLRELASGTHPERRNAARSALAALLAPGSADPASVLPLLAAHLATDRDVDVRILTAHTLGESANPRARTALQAALGDPDPNVVAAAAEALGILKDPRALESLVELAKRGDFWMGTAAIVALGELGERGAVPVLADLLPDPWLGIVAARALGSIGDAAALDPLRGTLNLEGEVRAEGVRAAAEIMGRNRGQRVPEWLRDAARAEESAEIEAFADAPDLESARMLGLAGTERASAALLDRLAEDPHGAAGVGVELLPADLRAARLLERLESSDRAASGERASLLGLLPALSDRAAIEQVAEHLKDTLPEVRAAASEALGRADSEVLVEVLEELRRDPSARLGVALTYGRIGSDRCTPLLELLGDPDPGVRAAAAEATGRCGLGAVARLREALRIEADPGACRSIVRALGLEGGDEAVEELSRVLSSGDAALRFEAVRALGSSGSEQAFPLLLEALSDREPSIRTVALSALGDLGDARAQESLARHIDDPDRDRRRIAAVAIGRLFGAESVSRLEHALRDSDREVRLVAVSALGKLRIPGTGAILERVAEDDRDPLVRHTAAVVAAGLQDPAGEAP